MCPRSPDCYEHVRSTRHSPRRPMEDVDQNVGVNEDRGHRAAPSATPYTRLWSSRRGRSFPPPCRPRPEWRPHDVLPAPLRRAARSVTLISGNHEIHFRARFDPQTLANLLGDGHLAFCGDAHGNTSSVLLAGQSRTSQEQGGRASLTRSPPAGSPRSGGDARGRWRSPARRRRRRCRTSLSASARAPSCGSAASRHGRRRSPPS